MDGLCIFFVVGVLEGGVVEVGFGWIYVVYVEGDVLFVVVDYVFDVVFNFDVYWDVEVEVVELVFCVFGFFVKEFEVCFWVIWRKGCFELVVCCGIGVV